MNVFGVVVASVAMDPDDAHCDGSCDSDTRCLTVDNEMFVDVLYCRSELQNLNGQGCCSQSLFPYQSSYS